MDSITIAMNFFSEIFFLVGMKIFLGGLSGEKSQQGDLKKDFFLWTNLFCFGGGPNFFLSV